MSHYTKKITLYHYTTEENARRIIKDGMILQSEEDNRDAVFGDGVYLTDLAPYSKGKEEIAINNWAQLASRKVRSGHMDAAIKVKLSENEVICKRIRDRLIYLYEGDLWLPDSAKLILWDDD